MLAPILISLLAAIFLQVALWRHAVRIQNAAWVDLGWTLGMAMGGIISLGFAVLQQSGPRAYLVFTIVVLWALRLAGHIYFDRLRGGKPEDGRYVALRTHWGKQADRNFFFYFQAQAWLVPLFLLPPLVVAGSSVPFPSWQDVLGVTLALGAIAGERLADRQLARFRENPDNKVKVCQSGLWRYSRHPNYFCEWLHWSAYAVWGLGAPAYGLTWVGVVLMYLFLRFFTGIPHTERQSLKSRGQAYRTYQQTTNAFFPWTPRKPS